MNKHYYKTTRFFQSNKHKSEAKNINSVLSLFDLPKNAEKRDEKEAAKTQDVYSYFSIPEYLVKR